MFPCSLYITIHLLDTVHTHIYIADDNLSPDHRTAPPAAEVTAPSLLYSLTAMCPPLPAPCVPCLARFLYLRSMPRSLSLSAFQASLQSKGFL